MSRLFGRAKCQAPVGPLVLEADTGSAISAPPPIPQSLKPEQGGRSFKGKQARIVEYPGLHALSRRILESRASLPSSEFNSHTSTLDAIERGKVGAGESIMQEVRRVIDQIDVSFRDRTLPEWVETPAGAFPVIPEFLQGRPECMRKLQHEETDRSPIRIVIECTLSWQISNAALIRRGAALTALVMRIGEERPVDVQICWPTQTIKGAVIGLLGVAASPVNPSEMAYLLADPGFIRNLTHLVAYLDAGAQVETGLRFIWEMDPDHPTRIELLRGILGLSPTDIFIPGAKADKSEQIYIDPVGWVEDRIRRQRHVS